MGKTILNRLHRPELGDMNQERALAEARQVLFAARGERVRPGWDDKVLADWNGMMISALAKAAPVFKEAAWLDAAEVAFGFVVEHMMDGGRLKHANGTTQTNRISSPGDAWMISTRSSHSEIGWSSRDTIRSPVRSPPIAATPPLCTEPTTGGKYGPTPSLAEPSSRGGRSTIAV